MSLEKIVRNADYSAHASSGNEGTGTTPLLWRILTLGWTPPGGLQWYDKLFHVSIWLVLLVILATELLGRG